MFVPLAISSSFRGKGLVRAWFEASIIISPALDEGKAYLAGGVGGVGVSGHTIETMSSSPIFLNVA
jgi:hypothetical protein